MAVNGNFRTATLDTESASYGRQKWFPSVLESGGNKLRISWRNGKGSVEVKRAAAMCMLGKIWAEGRCARDRTLRRASHWE